MGYFQKTRHTSGGDRIVDMELAGLSNVFHLARRRQKIKNHLLLGHGKFVSATAVRHCREGVRAEHLVRQVQRIRFRHEPSKVS